MPPLFTHVRGGLPLCSHRLLGQDFPLSKSLIALGVHPKSPFSSEFVNLSESPEVDNIARSMFRLISIYTKDTNFPYDIGELNITETDAMQQLLTLVKKYPKLVNESYAQVIKQTFENPFDVVDPKKARRRETASETDLVGEGDPEYYFPETVTLSGHRVYCMPDKGMVGARAPHSHASTALRRELSEEAEPRSRAKKQSEETERRNGAKRTVHNP